MIVVPAYGVERSPAFAPTEASRALQADHLKRLRGVNFYPAPPFTRTENLVAQIVRSGVIVKALVKAEKFVPRRQPHKLPFVSLGPLFVGRDKVLDDLRAALVASQGVAVAARVLHGLGGVGKTRLAIEYAWRYEADYSALLFVRADDPATLDANIAALASGEVLDLAEKEIRRRTPRRSMAALRWLRLHPTSLMILDNVDDEKAVVRQSAG